MPLYKETKRKHMVCLSFLVVNFISTPDQPADIFTKALSSPRFLNQSVKVMGVLPLRLKGM